MHTSTKALSESGIIRLGCGISISEIFLDVSWLETWHEIWKCVQKIEERWLSDKKKYLASGGSFIQRPQIRCSVSKRKTGGYANAPQCRLTFYPQFAHPTISSCFVQRSYIPFQKSRKFVNNFVSNATSNDQQTNQGKHNLLFSLGSKLFCSHAPFSLFARMVYFPFPRLADSKDAFKTNLLSLLRRLSTWRCPHLRLSAGARAARRPQLSIDISCPQGAQQQTRRPSLLLSIDGTDRQTDRRPTVTYAPHTMGAASIICNQNIQIPVQRPFVACDHNIVIKSVIKVAMCGIWDLVISWNFGQARQWLELVI